MASPSDAGTDWHLPSTHFGTWHAGRPARAPSVASLHSNGPPVPRVPPAPVPAPAEPPPPPPGGSRPRISAQPEAAMPSPSIVTAIRRFIEWLLYWTASIRCYLVS